MDTGSLQVHPFLKRTGIHGRRPDRRLASSRGRGASIGDGDGRWAARPEHRTACASAPCPAPCAGSLSTGPAPREHGTVRSPRQHVVRADSAHRVRFLVRAAPRREHGSVRFAPCGRMRYDVSTMTPVSETAPARCVLGGTEPPCLRRDYESSPPARPRLPWPPSAASSARLLLHPHGPVQRPAIREPRDRTAPRTTSGGHPALMSSRTLYVGSTLRAVRGASYKVRLRGTSADRSVACMAPRPIVYRVPQSRRGCAPTRTVPPSAHGSAAR